MSSKKLLIVSLITSITLLIIKFIAYTLTHSNAILTDAVESIVNVLAGSFALFSIYYASRPADKSHPYGHGKIEFFSSGFEGGMITIAGIGMITKGIIAFFHQDEIHSIDIGIYLSLFAGLINYIVGKLLVNKGKKANSATMISNGKHLISDTISSIGLIIGLTIVYFTEIYWIDYLVAILFGIFIVYSGFKILRESVLNLLDKTDYDKVQHLIDILNKNRSTHWIDIHNLRVLKYGSLLHIDCHITLPWYNNLEQSHAEIDSIEKTVAKNTSHDIEFFIHADPCLPPTSCQICQISTCPHRQHDFVKKLDWDLNNVLPNKKHQLQTS